MSDDSIKLVPYSYFKHHAYWDKEHPELRDRAVFQIEKVDLDGDGDLDEVGVLEPAYCNSSRRANLRDLCNISNSSRRDLPYSLNGEKTLSTSLTLYSGPQKTAVTLQKGDKVYCGGHTLLTFDPTTDPVVVRGTGIENLLEAVEKLLGSFLTLGITDRLELSVTATKYLATSQKRFLVETLQSLNSHLNPKDRLSDPQIRLIAELMHSRRSEIEAIVKRTLKTAAINILSSDQPVEWIRENLKGDSRYFLGATLSPSRLVGHLAGGLEHQINFSPDEIIQIDHLFAPPKMGIGNWHYNEDQLPLPNCWLQPAGGSSLPFPGGEFTAGQRVWVDDLEDTEGHHIPFADFRLGTLIGFIHFSLGPQPSTPEEGLNSYAVTLQTDEFPIQVPASRLYLPIKEIPASDLLNYPSGIHPGDQLRASLSFWAASSGEACFDTQVTIQSVSRRYSGKKEYRIVAKDAKDTTYIGRVYWGRLEASNASGPCLRWHKK